MYLYLKKLSRIVITLYLYSIYAHTYVVCDIVEFVSIKRYSSSCTMFVMFSSGN